MRWHCKPQPAKFSVVCWARWHFAMNDPQVLATVVETMLEALSDE